MIKVCSFDVKLSYFNDVVSTPTLPTYNPISLCYNQDVRPLNFLFFMLIKLFKWQANVGKPQYTAGYTHNS